MQLLPAPINPVASNNRINILAFASVEFITKLAEIFVGDPYVVQLANDELNDYDVIQVTNDRNVVRKNVLGIGKIYEGREQTFPVAFGQVPLIIS